jgi:hypothetical protein
MTRQQFDQAVADVLGSDQTLRRRSLKRLHAAAFQPGDRPFPRDEFLALLRKLVDDLDDRIRERAVGTLAVERDQQVQERLLQELGTSQAGALAEVLSVDGSVRRSMVKTAAHAIQLLAYDGHGPHVPISREIAEDRSRPEGARLEALRVLAADPSSEDLLERIIKDRDEPANVRIWAGASLRALSPFRFAAVARPVLADLTEDPDLRAMCEVAFRTSRTLRRLG